MRTAIIALALFPAIGLMSETRAQPSDQALARAKQLKAEIKTFRLELLYNGQEDKPFYRLILSVPPVGYDRSNPFYRLAQITEAQAETIIEHLANEGVLDEALDLRAKTKRPPPRMPGYTMKASTKSIGFQDDLGWGLPMLKRLDGLRKVLGGEAAKGIDLLLGRLSGLRKQWEKEAKDQAETEEREVYVPKDLDDCFAQLKKILSKDLIEKMKTGPEEDMIDYHHGLGTWLRNNWGLWKGSRLSKWFNARGIKHPDDMSGIILDSFWRHLNNKPINLDEQVKYYQDYWKAVDEERKKRGEGK